MAIIYYDEPTTGAKPAPKITYEDRRQSTEATDARIAQEAAYKGVAGLGDSLFNAPTNAWNILKSIPSMLAREPLPEMTPVPDIIRRGMETAGMINPDIQPKGFVQKAIDYGVQGGVGGALTGGTGLARVAAGTGVGALSGELSGGTMVATGNPALATAAGMLPGGVAGAKASMPRPNLSPNVNLLNNEGVQMTPGQILGGRLKRVEDAATSFPFVGDTIKGAQRRGIESFSSAAINRGLAPIGEKLPVGLTGNKAIEYAYGKLGDAYENLLPNLKGDLNAGQVAGTLPRVAGQTAPPSFKQELDTIKQMGQNLPEPQRGQLDRIIQKEVIDRFTKQGLASGETLKEIESKLGGLSKVMGRSDNYDVRTLGDAIKETQAAMRRMINNVNPDHAGELAKINDGYANFKRVQNAAGNVGAQEGIFTPAQLHRAVKAGDISKDKARFAEGNATMQDLSSAGKAVLPSSVPDSGTPFRSMLAYAATHPFRAFGLGIPLSAATIPYTRLGQRFTQEMLAGQGGNTTGGLMAQQISPIATNELISEILRRQGPQ